MYMGLGVVVFLVTMVYSMSLGRFQNSSVVVNLLAGIVILFTLEWFILLKYPIYRILYLSTFGVGGVLGTVAWTVASEVTDARQAKRLFPFFASVSILGGVLGNSLAAAITKWLDTRYLVVLFTLFLGAVFFLAREITRSYFKPETNFAGNFNFFYELRAGYDFVRQSGLFRLLAIASILFSILFFTVEYPFNVIISDTFANKEAALTGFNGSFTSIQTTITFLISLFLANRIYARLGIVNSILIMPVVYLVCFGIFFASFQFTGAVIVRFMQLIVLGGLMGTAWSALFNVVPIERRSQVLAFMNGVPAQVGVVVSGVMLLVARQIFTRQQVLLVGVAVAILCFYIVWKMRAEYGNALLAALRAGRVDVFSDEDDSFAGYKDDPAALQVIVQGLRDPKPLTRRLAVEMLARTGNHTAVPDLIGRLSDEDASVRAAATQALADLHARDAFGDIMLGLDDPDDTVRERTLASLPKLDVAPSPELMRTLGRLLNDPNIAIQARAAALLVYLGESGESQAVLNRLLKTGDINCTRAALGAIREMAKSARHDVLFDAGPIVDAINHPSPVIRREAVNVAALLNNADVYAVIAERLADEDVEVRKAAAESLKQAWTKSRSVVLPILETSNRIAVSAALDTIPAGDEESLIPLRGYIQKEVSSLRFYRSMIGSIPRVGRATFMLLEALRHRELGCEERLMKAVGLFGNPQALELIRKSLNAGDASTRAAALEALETLGDRRITKEVLPILDRGGVFGTDDDDKMNTGRVVEVLLVQDDPWVRALGTYVISELKLRNFTSSLHKLYSDPSVLVRDSARDAIAKMDGAVTMKKIKNIKTLKTLSALDRILLLREVPIFSILDPVDLEDIANVAEEQLFSDQSFLCLEGEPGKTLFIIVSGTVEVVKRSGASETVLATRTTGEFVGEMAILESAPRSATLKARGDVRVLVIDGDAFNSILHDRPAVAISVLKHMSTRVRQLNEKVRVAG
ncbi:MAG: HEAT repeat domain-containing protein [Anaerolineales bacterium]